MLMFERNYVKLNHNRINLNYSCGKNKFTVNFPYKKLCSVTEILKLIYIALDISSPNNQRLPFVHLEWSSVLVILVVQPTQNMDVHTANMASILSLFLVIIIEFEPYFRKIIFAQYININIFRI
jgi:hypothetical protein